MFSLVQVEKNNLIDENLFVFSIFYSSSFVCRYENTLTPKYIVKFLDFVSKILIINIRTFNLVDERMLSYMLMQITRFRLPVNFDYAYFEIPLVANINKAARTLSRHDMNRQSLPLPSTP